MLRNLVSVLVSAVAGIICLGFVKTGILNAIAGGPINPHEVGPTTKYAFYAFIWMIGFWGSGQMRLAQFRDLVALCLARNLDCRDDRIGSFIAKAENEENRGTFGWPKDALTAFIHQVGFYTGLPLTTAIHQIIVGITSVFYAAYMFDLARTLARYNKAGGDVSPWYWAIFVVSFLCLGVAVWGANRTVPYFLRIRRMRTSQAIWR